MKELSEKEKRRKCSKCGSSPAEDPTVNLHRFPQPNKANKSRCELWAKFCFPNESWRSPQFQNKLFTEHKMLCDKHFKRSSFEKQKRLCKFSVPENDCSKESNRREQEYSDIEIVIKNEPDETIEIQENSLEIESGQTKTNLPQKSGQLKRRAEENVKTDPLKKTKNTNSNIQSQEDLDDTYDEWSGITTKYNQYDECELYGKLLTKKLRNYVVYERNILMFKIDGLLIEHPPGFDTSTHSYSTDVTPQKTSKQFKKTTSKVNRNLRKKSKKSLTSKSTVETFTYTINSNNTLTSSSSKIKKEVSQAGQISTENEDSIVATSISSTTTPSPLKFMNNIQNHSKASTFSNQSVKVTSSVPNVPAKVTSNIQFLPIKVTGRIPNQAIKVTSCISSQPVKVTSNIPNKAIKVTSNILNKAIKVTGNIPNKAIKVTSNIPNKTIKVTSNIPNEAIKVTSNIPNEAIKVTSDIPNQPDKVTSCILNEPVKVTSCIPNEPVQVTSCFPNEPVKVTSCIPNEPVQVTSCIPNEPVEVTSSIPNQSVSPLIASGPLPSHLPLHITIPQTKLIPTTKSKVITTSAHPKGTILILKSKSAKYVPSSQPPILITVPSLSTAGYSGHSTQCDMNSLEQLSSIAVDLASQKQNQLCYDENVMEDDLNDVSHEVVL